MNQNGDKSNATNNNKNGFQMLTQKKKMKSM